jgi:amino acid transporter
MIGAEFAVSAFVNPVLGELDAKAETAATRLFARKLGRAMPFWYALGFVLMVVDASIRRHDDGIGWLVVAAALFALVIVLTLIFLVPINNKIAGAQENVFPATLKEQHATWDLLHRGRVLMLAIAMVLFLVGIHA